MCADADLSQPHRSQRVPAGPEHCARPDCRGPRSGQRQPPGRQHWRSPAVRLCQSLAAPATSDDCLACILNRNCGRFQSRRSQVSARVSSSLSATILEETACRWRATRLYLAPRLAGIRAAHQANCAKRNPWPETQGEHHVRFTVEAAIVNIMQHEVSASRSPWHLGLLVLVDFSGAARPS